MWRERSNLLQIGLGLVVLGVVVKVALVFVSLFGPLANLAIAAGVVLAIIGLVAPGRR